MNVRVTLGRITTATIREASMSPRPFLSATHINRPDPVKAFRAKPGFDWSRVKWSPPRGRLGDQCSLCPAKIGEDDVPLMMWRDDASAAQFCEKCAREAFGLESYPEGGEA